MADAPLRAGSRYAIKHTTRTARAVVEEVEHRIDIHSLEPVAGEALGLNEIGRVRLRLSEPLVTDPYSHNRHTGSFILIDESTNDTVGAGMVVG
jgi:sulfate adenylyltransferase subunit 1 (EFTu-like GTPase family)